MSLSNVRDSSRREGTVWPLPLRIGFRFCFLYWLLYIIPSVGEVSVFSLLPFGGIGNRLDAWFGWPLAQLARVVGVYVFKLDGEAADWHLTGSGDTAMHYTLAFCIAVLAVVGTIVWSAIDERRGGRHEYRAAYAWLRLALRITLAITLLGYGFAKVYPGQFGLAPGLAELNETYGQSSPMHLLWFFMEYSRPSAIFGGLMEVVSGVLLLFERTETIGALGAAAVMLEVAVLNFCYDVPVKLYSTHLLLMSVFLLLPDMRPMWEFFVRRRTAALTGVWVPRAERRPLRIARRVAFGLVCFLCVWVNVLGGYLGRRTPQPHAPLYGIWSVDSVTGWPDANVPQRIVLDGVHGVQIRSDDGEQRWYPVEYNAAERSILFVKRDKEAVLRWDAPVGGKTQLRGDWMGVPVTINVHRIDSDTYLLTSRGFHWVQEEPFVR
jgi:uncharacterized membrane protein YphA (DoxX/SURF4 family)